MENPVLNDDTAGAALRALGAEADASGGDTSSATSQPESRAAGAEDSTTDETAPTPQAEGGDSNDPEKKPDDQAQKGQKQPPEKEPSAYEKAKKREAEAWKKITDEKAALAREREELARQRQPQRQPSKTAEPAKDDRGFTAADYEAAAKQFKADGEDDMAAKATAKAAELKQKDAVGQQTEQQQRFHSDWRTDMEQAIRSNAELGKPDSADAKELSQLLTDEPIFGHIPNGFSKAVALLNLRREAGQVKGLKETISKHETEIARLTKLTSISGGGPSGPPAGTKAFDDMSEKEQRVYLEREATRADTYTG